MPQIYMTSIKFIFYRLVVPYIVVFVTASISSIAQAEAMDNKINLREMLKRDFGLELMISGGFGQSHQEPIVIDNSEPFDASLTEMHVLRAIGKGRKILWRTLARTPMDNYRLEKFNIETKDVNPNEVITQRENYYFDVQSATKSSASLPAAVVFENKEAKLSLPYEIGWLHFDSLIDNEPTSPGLGQSLAYGAPGIKATIYVYDKHRSGIAILGSVRSEFESAVSDLIQLHPAARPLDSVQNINEMLLQTFTIDGELILIALTTHNEKFVKMRISYVNDPVLIDAVRQTIADFNGIVSLPSLKKIH